MATLLFNFDFGRNLALDASSDGHKWCDGKRERLDVPWGKLFGSHNTIDSQSESPENILYIMRNPLETIRSNWEFHGMPGTLNEYATVGRMVYWKNHVENYASRCAFVTYEDLCSLPIAAMDKIRTTFGLTMIGREYVTVKQKVGWLPPGKMSPRDGYNASTILRFKDILGNSFMGYRL